jgi:integrase
MGVFALWHREVSPSHYNHLRTLASRLIEWAIAIEAWHGSNPFKAVPAKRAEYQTRPTLTRAEVRRVARALPKRWRAHFWVTVFLGLRKGELLALRGSDFKGGILTVSRSHFRGTTKTGRPRSIPVPKFLWRYLKGEGLLFPSARGKQMHPGCRLTDVLRRALIAANIDKPMRWHDLRHTAATLHVEAGASQLAVRLLLGHAGRDQTAAYSHPGMKWLWRELDRLKLR